MTKRTPRNQVDALCKLMSEFIISQKQAQLPAPELIAHAAEEKAKAFIYITYHLFEANF